MDLKGMILWGKNAKIDMLCASIYITFSKWQKYRGEGHIISCKGLRMVRRGMSVTIKEQQIKDLCSDGIVLYLDKSGDYNKSTRVIRQHRITHTLLLLFICSIVPNSLGPHGLQPSRLPCHSLYPRVCSDSCPLSQWYHLTISSSVTLFSSYPKSFPASGSFLMSQLISFRNG